MQVKSLRFYSLLPVIVVILLMAYALYEEYVTGLNPCNLCMVQRYIFVLIAALYLITLPKPPQNLFRKLIGIIISLVSALGCFVSGRHVWLQNLPADEVPDCGPGLSFMLDNYPFASVVDEVLKGSGDCAEASWRFLGLTMPMWTFICFLGFIIYTLIWSKLRK